MLIKPYFSEGRGLEKPPEHKNMYLYILSVLDIYPRGLDCCFWIFFAIFSTPSFQVQKLLFFSHQIFHIYTPGFGFGHG